MNIDNLNNDFLSRGFSEEEMDTGVRYQLVVDQFRFVCYMEPKMSLDFIIIYRWNNNEVKGVYTQKIDSKKPNAYNAKVCFEKAITELPEMIGTDFNLHRAAQENIDKIF